MNEHLSPEDISRWFAGERGVEQQRHAGECDACSGRLDRMESTLGNFRGLVHDWSADQALPASQIAWQVGQTTKSDGLSYRGRWILAVASLLILVVPTAYWNSRRQTRAHELAHADVLLEQVDQEISRAVPQTMEPLVALVTWGNGPAEGSLKKEKQ